MSLLWLLLVSVVLLMAAAILLYHALKLPQLPKCNMDAFMVGAQAGPLTHRGGTPENTLAAITRSSQLGAAGIEVDLAFTKDGAAVLLHDDCIDRTSNGSGRVQDMTLQELKKLDFGSHSGFPGEQIPILSEAIEICEELDLLMLLEIKHKGFSDTAKALKLVKELFAEKPHLYNRIIVVSFYPDIVYRLRCQDKQLLVGLVTRTNVLSTSVDGSRRNTGYWKHLAISFVDKLFTLSINTWLWRVLGVSLLVANKNDILGGRVLPADWNKRGVNVIAWTVNNIQEKNHFKYLLKIPYLTDNVRTDESVPEQAS